jgi:hypothetical protein
VIGKTTMPPWRRLAAVVGVAGVLAAVAVGLASALDQPSGGPAFRDAAQPVTPGTVQVPATPPTATTPRAGGSPSLPPLRLILDHAPPDGIAALPAAKQVVRLRDLVARHPLPVRLVELGVAQQAVGDTAGAGSSFRAALRRDPTYLPAQAGLATVDGAAGQAGLDRAAATFRTLVREHPTNQLVVFNDGWVAAYRRDRARALSSWTRAASLDPRSPLGLAAARLTTAVRKGSAGP